MSVTEIIEQIKALPPEESAKVVDYLRTLEEAALPQSKLIRLADDRAAEEAGNRVVEEHAGVFKKLAQ